MARETPAEPPSVATRRHTTPRVDWPTSSPLLMARWYAEAGDTAWTPSRTSRAVGHRSTAPHRPAVGWPVARASGAVPGVAPDGEPLGIESRGCVRPGRPVRGHFGRRVVSRPRLGSSRARSISSLCVRALADGASDVVRVRSATTAPRGSPAEPEPFAVATPCPTWPYLLFICLASWCG